MEKYNGIKMKMFDEEFEEYLEKVLPERLKMIDEQINRNYIILYEID